MHIQLLLTGDELMAGDIVDSNSAMIAQQLLEVGVEIRKKVTVGDDPELLLQTLRQQTQDSQLLIVNGGLGPTQDDLTAEVLAKLIGQPLAEHPDAMAHLNQWCQQRGATLNAANLKQALLPAGCGIIPNPRGSAVGIHIEHQGCTLFCTPGVPSELAVMLDDTIIPFVQSQTHNNKKLISRFHVFGFGESTLQQHLQDSFPDWPTSIGIGFRAGAPTLEVKILADESEQALHQVWVDNFRALMADYITAEGQDNLASNLITELKQRNQKMTTAESCTGGLIASMITEIAGASEAFEAGIVSYANHIKASVLGVSEQDLETQGAVSEPVVRQMLAGALKLSGADYGVAVSGVAGPGGGSDDKPVGTVWIAWGSAEDIRSVCLYYPYRRKLFQTMVAGAALDLLRRFVLNISTEPKYLQERQRPAKIPATGHATKH